MFGSGQIDNGFSIVILAHRPGRRRSLCVQNFNTVLDMLLMSFIKHGRLANQDVKICYAMSSFGLF